MNSRKEYYQKYYQEHKMQKKMKSCIKEELEVEQVEQLPKYNEDYQPVKYDIRKVIHYLEEYAEKDAKTVQQEAIHFGYRSELHFFNTKK